MLKDFIAKLPIDVIVGTDIEDNKIHLPASIDSKEFYTTFKTDIETDTLTPEKAIYLASLNKQTPRKSISALLVKGR